MHEDTNYVVIDKPSGVPTHATVDNYKENASHMVQKVLSISDIFTPHRLDVDTSGLLLLGLNQKFTAWFSEKIAKKEVKKVYKCLVVRNSSDYSQDTIPFKTEQILTHYVKKDRTVPKLFFQDPPKDERVQKCQLRILSVSKVQNLQKWHLVKESSNDFNCAVKHWFSKFSKEEILDSSDLLTFYQIEVELLTGRTHQIRGQFAAMGWHLAGDNLYLGASTVETSI
mmetsp:Transcript_2546/g.3303  ORF Transcript_2546/g.3303 Transcript_2546/m.3303 type:complete len:226 (+) Transcript_2546:174-851(+)